MSSQRSTTPGISAQGLIILVFDTMSPEEPPIRYYFNQNEISVGRAEDCSIVLDSRSVSKRHAYLTLQGDQLAVLDLGSINGVYVDGERVSGQRLLRGGEEIFVGTFVLSCGTALRAPSDWGNRRNSGGVRAMRLYVGYVPEDAAYRDALRIHLAGLQREGLIHILDDQPKTQSANRQPNDLERMAQADASVLLVSPHYLASKQCTSRELQRVLQRGRDGRSCVLPVLVRLATLRGTPLEGLQLLPENGVPVSRWPDQDEAWVSVVSGLRRGLQRASMRSRSS